MLVAIHQPNFFPWFGYFDKISKADCFIFLDTVALWRGGSHYYNRVQVLIHGEPKWITMPLRRGEEARARLETARIAHDGKWSNKIRKTIEQSYCRAPFFAATMPLLRSWLAQDTDSLCEFNLTAIQGILSVLDIRTPKMVRARDIPVRGTATDLLINLIREVGGDRYLVGGGATGYQEDDKFRAAGIEVVQQGFVHPHYDQGRGQAFVPGLSIIDALLNCGPAGTAHLLEAGSWQTSS